MDMTKILIDVTISMYFAGCDSYTEACKCILRAFDIEVITNAIKNYEGSDFEVQKIYNI